jgi:hypothetical protein
MAKVMSDADIHKLLNSKPDFFDAVLNGKVSLKRYDSDPPRYELYWNEVGEDTPVNLSGDALWSWPAVQRAIFQTWKIVVDDIATRDWRDLLTILNDTRFDLDAPGASMDAEIMDILESWAERSSPKWSVSDLVNKPICKDGFYYFKMPAFETHALFAQGSRFFYQRYQITRDKLYTILTKAGGVSVVKRFGKKTIRVWRIAEGFNVPKEQADGDIMPDEDEKTNEPTNDKAKAKDKPNEPTDNEAEAKHDGEQDDASTFTKAPDDF